MTGRSTPPWQGSGRRAELPPDWDERRAAKHEEDPEHHCHWCGHPGGEELDHVKRGDDHSLENLGWIHGRRAVEAGISPRNCHGEKTSAEGHAARAAYRRPPKRKHPGVL